MPDVDLDKLRSIGTISRRTQDRVIESRDGKGYRTKAVTDQLGNTVTEHASPDDRVDVNIAAPHIRISGETQEVRRAHGDN